MIDQFMTSTTDTVGDPATACFSNVAAVTPSTLSEFEKNPLECLTKKKISNGCITVLLELDKLWQWMQLSLEIKEDICLQYLLDNIQECRSENEIEYACQNLLTRYFRLL